MQEQEAVALRRALLPRKPDAAPSQEEAAKTLLHGHASYDSRDDHTMAARYESGPVSLPDDISMSRDVREVLGVKDRLLIEGWQESMLLPLDEYERLNYELGEVASVWDRKLLANFKEYRKFIGRLDELGLIRWAQQPMERARRTRRSA